jgi:hypothetical protein
MCYVSFDTIRSLLTLPHHSIRSFQMSWQKREEEESSKMKTRERERERESFIRNYPQRGVQGGARARTPHHHTTVCLTG